MTLFLQYFRSQFKGLLLWAFFVGLVALLMSQNAPTFTADGALEQLIEQLPPAFQNMVGNPLGLNPIDGFISLEIGLWNSLLFSLYAIALALGIVTREVDRRTIDFLLSLPVDRRQVILSRIAVLVTNTALLAVIAWVTLATVLSGYEADLRGYALMTLGQWLLAMALAALCLLSSIWIDDYSFGVKAWMGGVATLLFVEMFTKAVTTARWARFWSPFSYVDAPEILRSGLPAVDVAVLILVALLGFGLSLLAFERKQISA